MTRAILIVLDSVGCGGAEDAKAYGDEGADTLGHIAEACADGRGDRDGLRRGPLKLPRLEALGLGHAMKASTGRAPQGFALPEPRGQWGYGIETSRGKDTPSGHWELAGTPVDFDWGYFPETVPAFPSALTEALIEEGKLAGILANRHASGTAVIEEYGEEHLRTLKPICYTSANSVLQIAAHEQAFGLERLYDLCRIARRLLRSLEDRARDRASFPRRERQGLRPHRQPQGFRHASAGGQYSAAGRPRRPRNCLDWKGWRHLRPPRHRGRAQGQEQRRQCRPSRRCAWDSA